MFITSELLFRVPVETTEGKHLGKVVGFEIDVETQSILRYLVRPSKIVSQVLRNNDLIIHRGQVVSITEERMLVEGRSFDAKAEEQVGMRMIKSAAASGMAA